MIKLVRDQDGKRLLQCCNVRVFLPHGRADMVRHLRLAHGMPTALSRQYVAALLQPRKRRTWWGEQYELFAQGPGEALAFARGEPEARESPGPGGDED